jgi:hypothetical protein
MLKNQNRTNKPWTVKELQTLRSAAMLKIPPKNVANRLGRSLQEVKEETEEILIFVPIPR